MIVCENCKQKMATEQTENGRSFPAHAVTGGLIGAAGALATGILLLVPAGLVAGPLIGLLGRRCGVCGNEIDDNEHAYHLLEELDDGVGGRFYKHGGNAQESASPVLPKPGPASRPEGLQSGGQIQRPFRAADELALGAFRETPSRDSLVFDEVEGRFVQAGSPPGEERINPDAPVDLDVDTCPDFEVQEPSGFEQDLPEPNVDGLAGFHEDMAADIDPFGPIDETPMEGM